MKIVLDFRSAQPIYLQIVDQVRQQVDDGALPPGTQLPTVRQLATDLRVNFNTVARAYRLLDEAGLISTQHGRGTYVWDHTATQHVPRAGLAMLSEDYIRQARAAGYEPQAIIQSVQDVLAKQSKE